MLINVFVVAAATSSVVIAYSEQAFNLRARDVLSQRLAERDAAALNILEHTGAAQILDKRYNRATPDTPIDPSILDKKGSVYTVDLSTFQAIITKPSAKQAYLVPNLRNVRNALLKLEGLMSNEANRESSSRSQDQIPTSAAGLTTRGFDRRAILQREADPELELMNVNDLAGSLYKREAGAPFFGDLFKKLKEQKQKAAAPPPPPKPSPKPAPPPQPSQPSAADQAKAKQKEQDAVKKAVESDRKARGVSTTTTTTTTTTQNNGGVPADTPPDPDLGAPLPDIPSLPPILPIAPYPMSPYPLTAFPLVPAPLASRPLYKRNIFEDNGAYAYDLRKRYAEAEARGGRLRRVGHAVGSAFTQLGGAIGNQMLDTLDPQAAQNSGAQQAPVANNQRRDVGFDEDFPFALHTRDAEAHEHDVDDAFLFALDEREPEEIGEYEALFEPELWF